MSEPAPAPAPPSARLRTLLVVLLALATPILLWDASLCLAVGRAARMLAEAPEKRREVAVDELRALGAAAVPDLVRQFIVPGDGAAAVAHGGGASKAAGPLTIPIMSFLRTAPSPAVIEALVAAVGDDDPDVRHYSGIALAWIGAPAEGPVEQLLLTGRTAHERTSAAWILAWMGKDGVPALPSLQTALHDEASDVRLMARFAIGQLSPGNEAAWAMAEKLREAAR